MGKTHHHACPHDKEMDFFLLTLTTLMRKCVYGGRGGGERK